MKALSVQQNSNDDGKKNVNKNDPINKNVGGTIQTKSIFTITELFGKIASAFQGNENDMVSEDPLKALDYNDGDLVTVDTVDIIAEQIRKEYEAIFWVTGNMDTSLWAEDCTFADPFSSFGGAGSTARFKKNADNLGKFVSNPKMKITSFKIEFSDDHINKDIIDNINTDYENTKNESNPYHVVRIGWSFTSKLKLPWYPILAAAGETFHYLDKHNGLIYKYEETWKSKPWDVVKRIFKLTESL
eukprot:CAMPEP_0119051508 /NCGR_PEP_ID=MMETSP1177-20130426/73095_1 /TAXON_ID=2985 /ORGANISM="Ochromonas sp, Strain CCMP1899" /LENGTH=243 /DNA_ID=CAMNT_0007030723 /DNA_START=335 /DNA_END=1066 /DNA_ORIENTATION=-